MKLIVCQSCEAEFRIKHSLNDHHYRIMHCPFCGGDIDDPNYIDEIEWDEDTEC
jgi:DNA-directed RNA polymerase subunit RPC12/RpoP